MAAQVNILSTGNSVLNQILYEMRDHEIQLDRMRFRTNLQRTGSILAYEISKELSYESQEVTTPLGQLDMNLPSQQPVLVSILRAGVPLHDGFLKLFDRADNGFISAFRQHTAGNDFVVKVEYMAVPALDGRDLVLIDPMIATGQSIVLSYKSLLEAGTPERVFIAGVVGSEEGIAYVQRHIPKARIYIAAVDKELTAKSYIVPGLGDAGDLAFGEK
ncbi:MAG: uracil phosphoribosyltransferase [Bacteroidia bacterium]|nr:uracil phosphoribosyltransferase [Bacteroidia bacterium]